MFFYDTFIHIVMCACDGFPLERKKAYVKIGVQTHERNKRERERERGGGGGGREEGGREGVGEREWGDKRCWKSC